MTNLTFTDEHLIALNQQGLIPGPEEQEKDFVLRADYCLHLRKRVHELEEKLEVSAKETDEKPVIAEAYPVTKPLYDITPDWIPLFFSNDKLLFWHGGCAWIFQEAEGAPTGAVFQLRKKLHESSVYLGIYERKELIAHELCHVGRMMFQEPYFEEVHAYRSSASKWRRWLGPIVQSSGEALIFLSSLVIIVALDYLALFSGQHSLLGYLTWLKLIPLILLVYGLGRLWKKQKTYEHCLKNLNALFHDEIKANAVIVRLTDKEIIQFAQGNPQAIQQYAAENRSTSLRWRLLCIAYFGL